MTLEKDSIIKLTLNTDVFYIIYSDDKLKKYQPALGGYYKETITESEYFELTKKASDIKSIKLTNFLDEMKKE